MKKNKKNESMINLGSFQVGVSELNRLLSLGIFNFQINTESLGRFEEQERSCDLALEDLNLDSSSESVSV